MSSSYYSNHTMLKIPSINVYQMCTVSHSESVHVKNTYLQIKCKYSWTFLYEYFLNFSWLFQFSCNYSFLFLLILLHAEYYISSKKRNEFKPVLLQTHAEFFSQAFPDSWFAKYLFLSFYSQRYRNRCNITQFMS